MDIRHIPGTKFDEGIYQSECLYNHYLPYHDQLNGEADEWIRQIKDNLGRAVLLREMRPGVVSWMSRLTTYISLYGYRFTKQDHLEFIHLTWNLLMTPSQETRLMETFVRVLLALLKRKDLLTPADLTLPWRPLYQILEDISSHHVLMNLKSYPQDFEKNLKNLIRLCRYYFPPSATHEILTEFRPHFCPHGSMMTKALSYCNLFLPTLHVEVDGRGGWRRVEPPPYTAWLKELLAFWNACSNTPPWEGSLLSLLSRLAADNIGCIDWSDLLPVLFHKCMQSFGLPVYYKRLGVKLKAPVISNNSAAKLIISSITKKSDVLTSLSILMNAINSYYHPTSTGSYSDRIVEFLNKLISNLMTRLSVERYEQPNPVRWVPSTRDEDQITDSQVAEFCRIVLPANLNLASSKKYVDIERANISILASIRPDIVIPPLIRRLEVSLETLTEPVKFTAAVKCIVSVSRNLVRNDPRFPAGQEHVLHILFSVLPGIDCNDIKKTLTVFQLISVIARLVPFNNVALFSKHRGKGGSSYSLKEFVLKFMDRCFAMIENSSLELIRQEQSTSDASMSSEESSVKIGIITCFDSILHQTDDDIKQVAIKKLEEYLRGRILEPKVAGKIASGMCRTCAKISPREVLASMVPRSCQTLLAAFKETDLNSDHYLGDEIMFNLLLLSDMVCVPGYYLLPFKDQINQVLKVGLSLKNREGHTFALTVFRHTLHALTHPCLAERVGIVSRPSANPLDDWGRPGDLNQLDLKWYLPSEQEFETVCELGEFFLGRSVETLEQFIENKRAVDKEELHKCLKSISSFIIGSSPVLPSWEEDPVYLVDTGVVHVPRRHVVAPPSKTFSFRFRGAMNTRKFIVDLLEKLLNKLLTDGSDDTKVMISIATILKLVVFQHTCTDEGLEKHKSVFQQSKSRLESKLLGKHKDIRAILVERILIQDEKRLVENLHTSLTETHVRIMNLLTDLSLSLYSKVRTHAQNILGKLCKWFSYSYKVLVPRVLSRLHNDPKITHEEFKGALYLILQNQLLVKHSWELQAELWPLLVKAQHNEKPSISALIKSITAYIHSIDSWTIQWIEPTDLVLDIAKKLVSPSVVPTPEEMTVAHDKRDKQSKVNVDKYMELVTSLCDLVEASDLHWRHYNTALSMLCVLLRHDIEFPVKAVRLFTSNLIHDDLLVRKASIHVVDCVLKKSKRKHPKISVKLRLKENTTVIESCEDYTSRSPGTNGCEITLDKSNHSNGCDPEESVGADATISVDANSGVGDRLQYNRKSCQITNDGPFQDEFCEVVIPDVRTDSFESSKPVLSDHVWIVKPGERVDNMFLQYRDINKPLSNEDYDAPRFIHKTHVGFYVWPRENLIYAPSSQQPPLDRTVDQMSLSEQVIYSFFADGQNVTKLFSFLTLENKKGHDFFDVERFGMFKALFRNFGDLLMENFRSEVESLVADHRESYQRAAAEILAAMVRGSKHWPYSKITALWSWLLPAIRTALNNVSPETQRDWGTCFATCSDNRDPNKLHWLMEVAMEEPIRSKGSFIDASRLYMLQGVVAQQRWRVGELLHRLLQFLMPFLDHPFHNVRSRLGAVLTNIFALDINFEEVGNASISSPIEKDFINKIFPRLRTLQTDEEKEEQDLRLLQTVSIWICCSLSQNLGPMKDHILQIIPILLQYEWYDRDPQLATDCQASLSYISRSSIDTKLVPVMCQILKDCMEADSWRTKLSTLDFLQAFVFNSFLHVCEAGPDVSDTLLHTVNLGLEDEQIEVRVKASQVLSGLVHCRYISEDEFPKLIKKFKKSSRESKNSVAVSHGSVLGLCAFVSAFPHDVPQFLPDLLLYLGSMLNQKQPISGTIKKTVQSFKRTHQDNWIEHKTKFSEDQLTELTNLLISPSYYA